MGWTSPPSWVAGNVIGATDLNTYIRDNTNYLLARPKTVIKRDNNANYTTTSTTFVDIDGTNLAASITISGSVLLMGFVGMVNIGGTLANTPWFDFTIDGTRYASAGNDGLIRAPTPASGTVQDTPVCILGIATGLSAGAHTVKVQWKVASTGTGTLYAGYGDAGT